MRPTYLLLALSGLLALFTILVHVWLTGLAFLTLPVWSVLVVAALADMLLSVRAGRLEVTFDMASKGFVGHRVALRLEIRSRKGGLPKKLTARLDLPEDLAEDGGDLALPDPEEKTTSARFSTSLLLKRRGQYAVKAIWLKWRSLFGLFDIITQVSVGRDIAVVPDISPVLSGSIRSQILLLENGQKDVWLRGEGSEFHQLREFVPGMDSRSIDWKRSARMGDLVVRETRAEKNHQIILCLDRGRMMMEDIGGMTRLDRSISAALSMCWAAGYAGDLVGLYSFNSRPRQFMPAMPGRIAFQRLQSISADMDYELHETNHTLGLTHLSSRLKRRSLLVIFSDFADSISAELMVENIGILARHHFIVFVALKDPELNSLLAPGSADMAAVARSVAARALIHERRLVMDKLARLGVLCLDSAADTLTASLIARYIDIKSREVI